MKKHVLIGLLSASLFVVGCAVVKCNESATSAEQSAQSVARWQKKNPQLFSNVGYIQQLEESAPKLAKLSESLEELRGVSTNPFGIRDDILQYIFTNIPESNESATKAAIKYMQYVQQIYYSELDESEIMELNKKSSLADLCLLKYSQDKISNRTISNLIHTTIDTDARKKYITQKDVKYFSWKVLGTGLNIAEEDDACDKGEF